MTYYILQAAAMLLVAYFLGCMVGAALKSLTTAVHDGEDAGLAKAGQRTGFPSAATPGTPTVPELTTAAAVSAAALAPAVLRTPVSAPAAIPARPAAAMPPASVSVAPAVQPPLPPSAPITAGEDLKRIKGIGPEIERKLNALGIRRYSEIAAWSASDVARINREIGHDGRVQHENWIEQAQILARAGETAFSRRVDRREVNTGMVDNWTPTAPNEVARQASVPAVPPVAVAPPPKQTVAPAAAISAASTASAAAAAAAASLPARAWAPPPAQVAATQPVQAPAAAGQPPAAAPISMRPVAGAGTQRRFVRLAAPEGKPDDLALIAGVGDKTAGDLNRYGVYHFWQLAAMGPDDIDYMETRLGHKGRMRREDWPEQARELMAGKPPRAQADRQRAAQTDPGLPSMHPRTHTHAHKPAEQPASSAAATVPPAPVAAPVVQQTAAPAGQAAVPPVTPASASPAVHAHPHTHHHQRPAAGAPAGSAASPPVSAAADAVAPPSSAQTYPVHRHHAAGIGAAAAAAAVAASAGAASRATVSAPVTTAGAAPPPPAAPVIPPAAPPAAVVVAPVQMPSVQVPPVQVQSVQAAPVQAAPVLASPPAPATVAAATDPAAAGGWTPRSRPGNVAARTRDDLKRIKGVGVVIEKKLEAMGITTYTQIAAWGTPEIDKVSNALDFKGRIEREQWVEQARILDGGGQTDFSRRMDRGDPAGGLRS